MMTANALVCGKKIQLIVIKIMSLGYMSIGRCQAGRERAAEPAVTPYRFPHLLHQGIGIYTS
ncbi:hypothetical protein [Symbiopectobacterium sp. RP]|uniref:hypothetical protein n=1 Tax=Symbiopectobacterium sp. RP TaxID=3248553 RepID=UPI003D2802EF